MSILFQSSKHYRLNCVHTVLGLIENYGSVALENIVRDLHTVDAEPFVNILTDNCIGIVEGVEKSART